jgi:DNA polymerase III delta subunit
MDETDVEKSRNNTWFLDLHRGDTLSLANEIDLLRRNAEDDEALIDSLKTELEYIKNERDTVFDDLNKILQEEIDREVIETIRKVADEDKNIF